MRADILTRSLGLRERDLLIRQSHAKTRCNFIASSEKRGFGLMTIARVEAMVAGCKRVTGAVWYTEHLMNKNEATVVVATIQPIAEPLS